MIPNVGPLDRALRLVLGAGLILAAAFGGNLPDGQAVRGTITWEHVDGNGGTR